LGNKTFNFLIYFIKRFDHLQIRIYHLQDCTMQGISTGKIVTIVGDKEKDWIGLFCEDSHGTCKRLELRQSSHSLWGVNIILAAVQQSDPDPSFCATTSLSTQQPHGYLPPTQVMIATNLGSISHPNHPVVKLPPSAIPNLHQIICLMTVDLDFRLTECGEPTCWPTENKGYRGRKSKPFPTNFVRPSTHAGGDQGHCGPPSHWWSPEECS